MRQSTLTKKMTGIINSKQINPSGPSILRTEQERYVNNSNNNNNNNYKNNNNDNNNIWSCLGDEEVAYLFE